MKEYQLGQPYPFLACESMSYSNYILNIIELNKNAPEADISIIILTYKGNRHIPDLFISLSRQTFRNFELIIVDNSPDSLANISFITKMADEYLGTTRITLVSLNKNLGFTGGNNLGIKFCRGKYIVLLNNDTVVDENWLKGLVQKAKESESIGLVGSVTIFFGTDIIESFGSHADIYASTFSRLVGTKYQNFRTLSLAEDMNFFFTPGTALLIKRHLIEEMGFLFDDELFMYLEDVDLCWFSRLLDYKIVISENSICYHKKPVLPQMGLERSDGIFYSTHTRNRLRLILKNYEFRNIIRLLPTVIILLAIRSLLVSVVRRNPIYLVHYIRGLWWNLRNLRDTFEMRILIQSKRKVSDQLIKQYMTRESLEVANFLSWLKPFSIRSKSRKFDTDLN